MRVFYPYCVPLLATNIASYSEFPRLVFLVNKGKIKQRGHTLLCFSRLVSGPCATQSSHLRLRGALDDDPLTTPNTALLNACRRAWMPESLSG